MYRLPAPRRTPAGLLQFRRSFGDTLQEISLEVGQLDPAFVHRVFGVIGAILRSLLPSKNLSTRASRCGEWQMATGVSVCGGRSFKLQDYVSTN